MAGGQITGGGAAPSSYATTVTLTSSYQDPDNPPTYGDSVTFTATVSTVNSTSYTPSGSVVFYDEATGAESDAITLADGQATWTLAAPDAEDHYIVATYTSNSTTYVDGTTGEFDQTVNPGDPTVAVSVFDNTQDEATDSPTYADSLTITATVSPPSTNVAIPEYDQNANHETVDFYDQTSGQFLGEANLVPNNDGTATATWSGTADNEENTFAYNLGIGSYSIIAVYNGDDNFNGSQSGGTPITVGGNGLSLGMASVTPVDEGQLATLTDTVTGLDGAGFRAVVNWGDGTSSDSDNGSQPFYFAAGATRSTA